MADERHLEILIEGGVDRWNQWRQENPEEKPSFTFADLSEADLTKANFSNANLGMANLSLAVLREANLRNAILCDTNLCNANLQFAYLRSADLLGANLSRANLSNAILFDAALSKANLANANLTNANLDSTILTNANLTNANLTNADLSDANLGDAKLCNANLSSANLLRLQALGANFLEAKFTGACIQDWHINRKTQLDNADCEFVFLKHGEQERYPSDRNFVPGEFAKVFQELENIVELIFHNGLNWRAFAFAFNQVNTRIIDTDENGEMFLREYKVLGDGLVSLKVVTPVGSSKTGIHDELMSAYNKISMLEGEIKGKDAILSNLPDLLYMALTMAGDTYNNDQRGAYIANNANKLDSNARQQAKQYIYTAEQKQIAQEIQQIYDQLLQTQAFKTVDEFDLAKQLKAEIEKRPTLKQRFIGALKNGGAEALKELVNRSGFNILLEFARGWMNPD